MNRGVRTSASGPHPVPLPRAGEGEDALRISKGLAWGRQEWKVMACAARFGQVVGGHTRHPLPWERVGVRGSRIGSWEAALAKAPCSRTWNQKLASRWKSTRSLQVHGKPNRSPDREVQQGKPSIPTRIEVRYQGRRGENEPNKKTGPRSLRETAGARGMSNSRCMRA